MIELSALIFGHPITVTAMPAGNDWNVIILGGCTPHVGSVSLAEFEHETVLLHTLQRSTHKDQIVSDRFARVLAEQCQCTVCVSCGIHYDGLDSVDLEKIITCTDHLLNKLCRTVSEN